MVNAGVHVVNAGVHLVNAGVHVVNAGVHVVSTKKIPVLDPNEYPREEGAHPQEIWNRVKGGLAAYTPKAEFDMWIRGVSTATRKGNSIVLVGINSFCIEWLTKYQDHILSLLKEEAPWITHVVFEQHEFEM